MSPPQFVKWGACKNSGLDFVTRSRETRQFLKNFAFSILPRPGISAILRPFHPRQNIASCYRFRPVKWWGHSDIFTYFLALKAEDEEESFHLLSLNAFRAVCPQWQRWANLSQNKIRNLICKASEERGMRIFGHCPNCLLKTKDLIIALVKNIHPLNFEIEAQNRPISKR